MPRLLVLSLALSLLVAAPAEGAKRCKQGTIRVAVNGKKVSSAPKAKGNAICVKVPRAGARALPLIVRDARIERWRKTTRIRALARYAKNLAAEPVASAAQARPVLTLPWRDVTLEYFHGHPPKGVTVSEHDAKTEPRPDEAGVGPEIERRLTLKTDKGYATARNISGTTQYRQKCPDADGRVRGEYGLRIGNGMAERPLSYFDDSNLKLDLTAEIGDDGQVKRYSYAGTLTRTYDRTVEGKREPTTSFVIKLSNQDLDPRATGSMLASFIKTGNFEIRGVQRAPTTDERADLVTQVLLWADVAQGDINRMLLSGEQAWNVRRECITIEITGAPESVMLGGRFSVTAVARAADRSVIPDAKLIAGPGWRSGGTLTPASASNPGRFTLADFGEWRAGDQDYWPSIGVTATSRRGTGYASVTVRAVPIPPPTAYWSVTFEGTLHHTTYVERRDSSEWFTANSSMDSAFKLEWPQVRLADEQDYEDGQSAGSLTYDYHSRTVTDDGVSEGSCASAGTQFEQATMSTRRAGAIEGLPFPTVPSFGFDFATPPLRAALTCGGEIALYDSDDDRCIEGAEGFINPQFYVSIAQLHQPLTKIAVGESEVCEIADGTARYQWDGTVTFVYHER